MLVFIIYVGFQYDKARNEDIKSNCSFVLGRIIDVNGGGVAFDISVSYMYLVNNVSYVRTVEIMPRDKHNFKGWNQNRDWSDHYVLGHLF